MSNNAIIDAWEKHPECRAEFVKEILLGRYKSLFERLEEENIKVGLTNPD